MQAGAAQANFFEILPDMPQAPSLHVIPDQSFVYDKPFGRIVALQALLDKQDAMNVESFYRQTLPVFGWQQQPDLQSYVREDEVLRFWFEDDTDYTLFYLTINPLDP